MAEPLSDRTRATLYQVFGCPVLSRYATEELGVLAHECCSFAECRSFAECNYASHHHLNIASYVTEVLSVDGDKPVSPGELGRVVVTDPFSYAMPLIRYETGDLAILGDACPCGLPGPTLERFEGRTIEQVLGTNGQRISPFAIIGAMKDLQDVIQYQFVQQGEKSYELRLVIFPSFHQEELAHRRLLDILGADAELKLNYVEQIPPLPSGKRPYIVNEWHQHQIAE